MIKCPFRACSAWKSPFGEDAVFINRYIFNFNLIQFLIKYSKNQLFNIFFTLLFNTRNTFLLNHHIIFSLNNVEFVEVSPTNLYGFDHGVYIDLYRQNMFQNAPKTPNFLIFCLILCKNT